MPSLALPPGRGSPAAREPARTPSRRGVAIALALALHAAAIVLFLSLDRAPQAIPAYRTLSLVDLDLPPPPPAAQAQVGAGAVGTDGSNGAFRPGAAQRPDEPLQSRRSRDERRPFHSQSRSLRNERRSGGAGIFSAVRDHRSAGNSDRRDSLAYRISAYRRPSRDRSDSLSRALYR